MIPPDQIGALEALLRRRRQTPLEELIPENDPIWELIFSDTPGMQPGEPETGFPGFPVLGTPALGTPAGISTPSAFTPIAPADVTAVGPPPNVPYATTGGSRPITDPKTGFARPVVENVPIAVPPVLGGKFGSDFGVPRPGGRTHQGNDIFAPAGTPIYATMDGTVEYGDGNLGGLYAKVVDPGTGTYTYNAHMSRIARKPGPVKAGEIIGYVGNTGNAQFTAPHNHFEYHPAGGPAIDPYNLLAQVYELTRTARGRQRAIARAPKHKEQTRAPAVRPRTSPATSPQQRR